MDPWEKFNYMFLSSSDSDSSSKWNTFEAATISWSSSQPNMYEVISDHSGWETFEETTISTISSHHSEDLDSSSHENWDTVEESSQDEIGNAAEGIAQNVANVGRDDFPEIDGDLWNVPEIREEVELERIPYVRLPVVREMAEVPPDMGLIRDWLPFRQRYCPIEVIGIDPLYVPKIKRFYTHWIGFSNPYWDPHKGYPERYFDGKPFETLNPYDGALVELTCFPNGSIHATREGTTVILQYEDKDYIYGFQPELPDADPPLFVRNFDDKEDGVPTQFIELQSPYWSGLLYNVVQPTTGLTLIRRSEYDGVKCYIFLESNGSVIVQRKFAKIQLLEPF